MKKMLSLALALLMVLSLAACGGSGGNAPSSSGGSATGSGGAGADGDKPYAGTTISVVVCTSAFMDQLISDIPEFEEATRRVMGEGMGIAPFELICPPL